MVVNGGSDYEVEFEGGSPVDTLWITSTLEQEAYPALDELTSKISTINLEHVRHIKSRLVGLFGRVQRVRDELENLLDDDMDMADMYLTDKLARKLGENLDQYIDFCRKREVLPNDAIVSSFSKAKLQKSCFERSILQVLLDLLMDVDVPPLIETFSLMGSYEIDAIDIINESPCILKRENVMSLMRAANQKLRVVDINDFFWERFFTAKLQRRRRESTRTTGPDQVDDERCTTRWRVTVPKDVSTVSGRYGERREDT
ncbi:hypothetical protein Scep_027073 [Stephania cephalantha]|uniref:DWD hypersensitive to UV-B 1 N-terminal domain-containing protein n=1 Tax=Stephania cephalantha TaxID=152367 RepID=A0AAP0EV93_9MAGN